MPQLLHGLGQPSRINPVGAPGRSLEQICSNAQSQRNILRRHLRSRLFGVWLRVEPLHEVMRPGVEMIDPRLDREPPRANSVHWKPRPPQVVGQWLKLRLVPLPLRLMPVQQPSCDVVMPVSKDRCGHLHHVADHSLRRIFTAVHLRLHLLNDDATASLRWFHAAASTRYSIFRCSLTRPAFAFTLHPIPLEAKSTRR